jgi:hypothetical protein
MTNQSLARRQATGVVVQQRTAGRVVQHTQSQLQEIQGVILTAAVAYDTTRRTLEAYVGKGGRSAGHQRYLEERTGNLIAIYDGAMQHVVRSAVHDIIVDRPQEIRTVYVEQPRKPWYHRLSSG